MFLVSKHKTNDDLERVREMEPKNGLGITKLQNFGPTFPDTATGSAGERLTKSSLFSGGGETVLYIV